jgi:hypothetical protein
MNADSIDKILKYFRGVASSEFEWEGTMYSPIPLIVDPALLRPISCNMCGACCLVFSLDYLPSEFLPPSEYTINWRKRNDRDIVTLEVPPINNKCGFLVDGKCSIHGKHPFSCDFELIRFIECGDHMKITQAFYGRGWNMTRSDGRKGALCKKGFRSRESIDDVVRKLMRLELWCDYFGIPNKCAAIIQHITTPALRNKRVVL